MIKRLVMMGGVALFAFIGVTGGLLYQAETIPGNAKIFIYPSERSWAPDSWFMERDFKRSLDDPTRAAHAVSLLAEQQPGTYADVKSGGKFAGFEPFPVLLKEPGNVMRGWNGSVLMWWLFGKPRWNPDGSWNW